VIILAGRAFYTSVQQQTVKAKDFEDAVSKLLSDPEYSRRAQKVGRAFCPRLVARLLVNELHNIYSVLFKCSERRRGFLFQYGEVQVLLPLSGSPLVMVRLGGSFESNRHHMWLTPVTFALAVACIIVFS
jgi:hypothetical protein